MAASRDLGDAPAQAIIEKIQNTRLKRHLEETSEELTLISNRVGKTLKNYEDLDGFDSINSNGRNNSIFSHRGSVDSTLEFVEDMSQLSTLLSDPVMKRKYQQNIAVFIVGYESLCGNRLQINKIKKSACLNYISTLTRLLQLLSQINDSLYNFKDQPVLEMDDPVFDVDHIGRTVRKTITKAMEVETKLKDIGQDIAIALNKLNDDRRKHSKKKTEMELVQIKEHILSITEKLMDAQEKVENTNEKLNQVYRNLEVKQIETERLKAHIEGSKKRSSDADNLRQRIDEKDKDMRELIKQNDRLSLVIAHYKEKQAQLYQSLEEAESKQKKLEKDGKIHEQLMEQQVLAAKRETEKHYEIQLDELKVQSESKLDEEIVTSKKKLASMDATIYELRGGLTKQQKAKEDAINNILTRQAQKEMSEQNNSFNDSLQRIVKYEKELKASHDKNKELQNKMQEEGVKKKTNKKKISKGSKQDLKIGAIETRSAGVQADLPITSNTATDNEGCSVVHTNVDKYVSEEVFSAPHSDEILNELAHVKSKYNQKMLLVTKLIEGQDKFMRERVELLHQVEMATGVKEDIEKELRGAMIELEKVRVLHEQANLRINAVTKDNKAPRIDTMESGVMTSPIPNEEKPMRDCKSAQTQMYLVPPSATTALLRSSPDVEIVENEEKLPELSAGADDDGGDGENQRLSTAVSAKSRASSVSSMARYKILESCLRSHPMVVNIRESYDNILQLKDEVIAMLEIEDDCKDCEMIVKNITLEEIKEGETEDGNMADIILKMAVNSTRILTILQQVIPSFMGRDDVSFFNQSTGTTPTPPENNPPESSISVHMVNRSTTITLPSVRDQYTQKDISSGASSIRHSASGNNDHDRLADDYEDLIYKHNNLEQDFLRLRKQSESTYRAHQHILSNNASTIQDMKSTIANLRNQLKETRHSAYKDEEFIFTRVDVEYNESTLRQGLREDQVDENTMEEAKTAMMEYASIPVQRWGQLVRRYLHRTRMKSIQKILESPQYNLQAIFNQMQLLERKRNERHYLKSAELARERIRLAKVLIERLETIENKTGVFMIKPIATIRPQSGIPIGKQRFNRRTRTSIPDQNITLPVACQSIFSKCIVQSRDQNSPPLWNPNISSVDDEKLPRPEIFNGAQLRIPRLLELDVNRTMYSENQISTFLSPKTCITDKDNHLNLITYMTVERPGALGNLNGSGRCMPDSDDSSITTSIKRPTSLPSLISRLPLVTTEETLSNRYRRSVSAWNSDRERKLESPMIQN